MVRTYNYNPSTQCLLDFAGVRRPCFEPASSSPPLRRIDAMPDWQLGKSNRNELRYAAKGITPAATKHNYPSNYSSTSNSSDGSHRITKSVEMMADITQLFGVRSVMIDGQRFYQPIDMSEKFGSGFMDDSLRSIGATKTSLHQDPLTGKLDQGAVLTTLRYASSMNDLSHRQSNYASNKAKSVMAAYIDGE